MTEEMAEWSPNIVYVNELLMKIITENINEIKITDKDDLMNLLSNEKNFYNEEGIRGDKQGKPDPYRRKDCGTGVLFNRH
jgi:hypothetical protein